jgi:N-glycosylase/DNA lyase
LGTVYERRVRVCRSPGAPSDLYRIHAPSRQATMVRGAPLARAAPLVTAAWTGLGVHPLELRLDNTLENGQCFGWRRQPGDASKPVWVGVLGEHVLALCQTEDDCMFRCVGGPAVAAKDAVAAAAEEAAVVTQLRDYFQLDEPLRPLYNHWAAADHRMAAVAEVVPGMRVLRQDPAECLFSFICSSNNNIGRIGGMLQNLRAMYGTPIPTVGAPVGTPAEAEAAEAEPDRYYSFPSVQSLAAASDAELRSLGMGYRADYIRRR